MPEGWLEPTPVTPLSGDERFAGTDATVRDFWSWAFSDLRVNVTRGVVAEFLVAQAVGAEQPIRVEWDNYDVLSPTGVRIEIKSAAYCQSWSQRQPSAIRFSGLSGLAWSAEEGWGSEREVRADVFVFAIQMCKVPEEFDILDLTQWAFYVVPAACIREHGARSVGLAFVRTHAGEPLAWEQLGTAIERAASPRAA